jgi:NADH-quinone oxidoreductase subunit I
MLGEAIIKGMAVTAKNFVGSYVSKERLTTVQYPEERQPLSEAVRSFPFLVYDGEDWQAGLRCVSCQICEKECPPKCIYIVKSKEKKPDFTGKPQLYPAIFDIDLSVCMSCGICAEVCPFEAIMMDQDFELSNTDRFGGLMVDKEALAKPHDHHMQIRPSEAGPIAERRAAAVVKAKVAAEVKKKAAAEKAKAAASQAGSTASGG